MEIPKNITEADLTLGAEKIIAEGIPPGAHSSTYDVLFRNKLLPPKLVVSYANIFANGNELDRKTFEGGLETECFRLLKENGFKIYRKDNIFTTLIAFIAQAKAGDLKTSHYPKTIMGLDSKISFGQGGVAKIPWISLLKSPHTTSNGIYPVYLFFKELDLLILSFGVSETNKPQIKWDVENPKSITGYFRDNNLGKPDRYGESFIFRTYKASKLPAQEIIETDLAEIVNIYNNVSKETMDLKTLDLKFDYKLFSNHLDKAGLIFDEKLTIRFIASLITKPFVVLSGLSGSGKTKLAQAFTQWICSDTEQFCIVPVGADWTNREPLLGYPNALKLDEYIRPENGVLDLIIRAANNSSLPFFLILDEMNLSHVERYFADFLSVMESGGDISLFSGNDETSGVPPRLKLPKNLYIIGTVNIDETTYMFSPKVLDRANAIEFRVNKHEIENFLLNQKEINMDELNFKGNMMASSFLEMSANKSFPEQDHSETTKTLVSFFEQLKKSGAEFGYRSASDIIRLINQLAVISPDLEINKKVDIAIMQKLLPKLHGSRRRICPVLILLGSFCVDGSQISNIAKEVFSNEDFEFESKAVIYPISLEKITRMYKGAIDNGFASYAEA